MKLLTRLNLVVAGLTAAFVIVLIPMQIQNMRMSIKEEITASNIVAMQLLRPLATVYSSEGGLPVLLQFLNELGRVRANEITLRSVAGDVLYRSPPTTYKAGREAPAWFSRLLAPTPAAHVFLLAGEMQLVVEANFSRAVLDAWDDSMRLLAVVALVLAIVNGMAFWLVRRALEPFAVITEGLERVQRGELAFRLPALAGFEARAIGTAFNRMAKAVEDKVQAERKAYEAESRLEERRELAHLVEQRIEEERRLIAHELHDEFGQSVTAIRSIALSIAARNQSDPAIGEAAHLISNEAARLYDAMHGLIPRLTPLSLDTLGLADTLENLVRDWQRRYPSIAFSLRHDLASDLGPSVMLAVYRVVQEGLINAIRHAQAARVDVRVQSEANRLIITITDDGVGLSGDWSRPGHFGLRGLAERVEHLGGTLSIGVREPHGARLTAEIPVPVSI